VYLAAGGLILRQRIRDPDGAAQGSKQAGEIARHKELAVTASTISFHLRSIYEKFQVHSKTQAVVKAVRHRLI